jgi:hypothetical protein
VVVDAEGRRRREEGVKQDPLIDYLIDKGVVERAFLRRA